MADQFHLLTVSCPDGTVRVVYSDAAKIAIPDFEEYLVQMVSIETIAWPPNIFITLEKEAAMPPDGFVRMPLPDWLIQGVDVVKGFDRDWRTKLFGVRFIPLYISMNFPHLFGYYLTLSAWAMNGPDGGKTEAGRAISARLSSTDAKLSFGLRIFSDSARIVVPALVVGPWLLLDFLLRPGRKAKVRRLRMRVGFYQFRKNRAKLVQIQSRLEALGVPREEVRKFDLPP